MLDEDVQLSVAGALRARGCDAVHVSELGRRGFSDREQFDYAVAEQRCVFTFNVSDFVQLHATWLSEQREHFGIVVSKQRTVGDCLRRLLVLLQTNTVDDVRTQIIFL